MPCAWPAPRNAAAHLPEQQRRNTRRSERSRFCSIEQGLPLNSERRGGGHKAIRPDLAQLAKAPGTQRPRGLLPARQHPRTRTQLAACTPPRRPGVRSSKACTGSVRARHRAAFPHTRRRPGALRACLRLGQHRGLVQRLVQFGPPQLKVGLDVVVVVALALRHQRRGAQRRERAVHPLAHRAEVLVLLVAQAKDAERHALRAAGARR